MKIRNFLSLLMFLLPICFLSAQEHGAFDSVLIRFPEKNPISPIKANPFLTLPQENNLDAFRNSDEFQKIPFIDHPNDFPKTWEEFKTAFLALPLPQEFELVERFHRNMEMGKKYPLLPSLWLTEEEILRRNSTYQRPIPAGIGIASTSVFQELYDLYSHEGKMKQKYEKILSQDSIDQRVARKYDVALVKQLTGFNDSTAMVFMNFCDFKNDSILQVNNYDVYTMILDCLSRFMKLQEDE